MKTQSKNIARATKSRSLMRDERGLSTVEYVILLVLIGVTGITLWTNFGNQLKSRVDAATKEMKNVKKL